MAYIPITNLGNATDFVFRLTHEDDSPHLGAQDIKFWLNESERILLGEKYYPFLDVSKIFVQSVDTKLNEAIAVGNTDFDVVDSSDLFSAGTVLIDNDFISYTANDGVDTLSGVTGIAVAATSATKVRQVYSLATDLSITQFDKPISLHIDDTEYIYYDARDGFNNIGYTIYDGYLIIPHSTSGGTVTLKYKAGVGNMDDDTDVFTTPQKYIGIHVQYAVYMSKMAINDPTYPNHYREYLRLRNLFLAAYGNQTERKDKFLRSPYA